MKKKLLVSLIFISVLFAGCTKRVVFLDRNINETKLSFDNFIKTTGYSYKLKDDVNNIYNVHIMEYNMQYLLQSKPMYSQNLGFTCKFKEMDNKKDTLVDCKTYPSFSGIGDIRRYIKEQKWEGVKFVTYQKYQKYKKENL